MSRKNKKIFSLLLSIFMMAALVVIGCAPQERPNPDNEQYGTRFDMTKNGNYAYDNMGEMARGYGNGRYTDNRYSTRFDNPGPYTNTDPNRLYGFFGNDMNDNANFRNTPMDRNNGMNIGMNDNKAIEQAVERLGNVDDCTVVKSGDTAYIGVDTNGRNNENIAALRTQIANKSRSVDPSIKRVYVTTDDNKVTKLKNYARDIDLGQPARNFLDDIEDLFR